MSQSKSNRVTLFSNGIAHFQRVYSVGKSERIITIPFAKKVIGDVATTIQVFGAVKYVRPPAFSPNSAKASSLKIDQKNSMKSLLKSLGGATVSVKLIGINAQGPLTGTLLGVESDDSVNNGTVFSKDYIVLMLEKSGVIRKPMAEIDSVQFTDEIVTNEIAKALKESFQQVKPESTIVELALLSTSSSDSEVEAEIQYTVPNSAWKMRYAIHQNGDTFRIDGSGVIDNNTEEDWDDFQISLVTGSPNTFFTDIANVAVPERKTVNLVDDQTTGNVNAADGYNRGVLESTGGSKPYRSASPAAAYGRVGTMNMKNAMSSYTTFGVDEGDGGNVSDSYGEIAEFAGGESEEVGDFTVFSHKEPITIKSGKMAIVPMFSHVLTKAGIVLFYNEARNPHRPFRTVKFRNETGTTLGKGATVVYNKGVFSGECVLDTTKPGETRMLPHCPENGVKIVKELRGDNQRIQSLQISDGFGVVEQIRTAEIVYVIENKKDESFKMAVEHTNHINSGGTTQVKVNFEGVKIEDREKLSVGNSHRVYFELEPKAKIELKVREELITPVKTRIGDYNWLRVNIIDTSIPLESNKNLQEAATLQGQIDATKEAIAGVEAEKTRMNDRLQRLRDNIEAARDSSSSQSTVSDWITEMGTIDTNIENSNKKIDELELKVKSLKIKIAETIMKMSAKWSATAEQA